MQESIRMRVTQVLERSRINTPLSVTFTTKTVWYFFMYWLLQSIFIAAYYGGTAWFLPLFNLVNIGWAWDKITTVSNSNSNRNSNIRDTVSDLESGESASEMLEMSESSTNSHIQASSFISPNKRTFFQKDESIVGDNANKIISSQNTPFSDNLFSPVDETIENIRENL